MIELSVAQFPQKELIAKCSECGMEVWRSTWDTYSDYNRIKVASRRKYKKCPHCKKGCEDLAVTVIKWQKSLNGDYIAQAPEGDFLIWRYGRIWKARWRVYGSDKPVMLGFSSTLEGMKHRCERSQYWPKGGES